MIVTRKGDILRNEKLMTNRLYTGRTLKILLVLWIKFNYKINCSLK